MLTAQFQCEHGFESYIFVFYVGRKFVSFQQFEENNFHGNHCVAVADTIASARRKRNKTAGMTFCDIFWQKIVGIKNLSFFTPNVFAAMQCEYVQNECGSLWYNKTLLQLKIGHCLTKNDGSHRRNSQSLFNHTLHILQLIKRFTCYFVVVRSENFVDFLDETILNVLMLRKKQNTVSRCGSC